MFSYLNCINKHTELDITETMASPTIRGGYGLFLLVYNLKWFKYY